MVIIIIIRTFIKLLLSLTLTENKYSFFSRSDANSNKVDLIFKQSSLEGLFVLLCNPTLGHGGTRAGLFKASLS